MTEYETENYKQSQEGEYIEPKYMTTKKKHYYLASVDENVSTLKNVQKQDLTKVLIELKSQYDAIKRETEIKKAQTEELDKKINKMQEIEKNTRKQFRGQEEIASDMQECIDRKKGRLQEEIDMQKTLKGKIEKIKQDILLTKKVICEKEGINKRLNKDNIKERNRRIQLNDEKNAINQKSRKQERTNEFNRNEHDMQLTYYRTIIMQKQNFIKAVDERKERQQKIAQEAKNDSQDKQEVELRLRLCCLTLFNKYLRAKMEKELKKNEKLEAAYCKVRDICGTSNLRILVEKILYKDKRYNESVSKVERLTRDNKEYDKEILELQEKLLELKTKILIKEQDEEIKSISTIPLSTVEEDDVKLMAKENELKDKLVKYQEKHKNINLTYNKIINNMEYILDGREFTDDVILSTMANRETNNDTKENQEQEFINTTENYNNASGYNEGGNTDINKNTIDNSNEMNIMDSKKENEEKVEDKKEEIEPIEQSNQINNEEPINGEDGEEKKKQEGVNEEKKEEQNQGGEIEPIKPPNNQGEEAEQTKPPNNQGEEAEQTKPQNNQGEEIEPVNPQNNQGEEIEPINPSNNQGEEAEATNPPNNQGENNENNNENNKENNNENPEEHHENQGGEKEPVIPSSLQEQQDNANNVDNIDNVDNNKGEIQENPPKEEKEENKKEEVKEENKKEENNEINTNINKVNNENNENNKVNNQGNMEGQIEKSRNENKPEEKAKKVEKLTSKAFTTFEHYQMKEQDSISMTKYTDLPIDDAVSDLQLKFFKFLKNSLDKYHELFLLNDKKKFIEMMTEKGIQVQNRNKKRGTKKGIPKLSRLNTIEDKEKEKNKWVDDEDDNYDDEMGKAIFRKFMEDEKTKGLKPEQHKMKK